MVLNTLLSLSLIFSGFYCILAFIPASGSKIFPQLYAEEKAALQRFALLATGVFAMAFGLYSLLIQPVLSFT